MADSDFPRPDGGQTEGGESLRYTEGQDGGSPLLVTQTRICSQCGSPMYPGFSLSGMWVNFTHLIKNRWICDSGHIYDEE